MDSRFNPYVSNQIKNSTTLNRQNNNRELVFSLSNVDVYYGLKMALKNITLDIELGDFIFLTGANGAGKSTLLNLLSSEIQPTDGKVILHSKKGNRDYFISRIFQDLKIYENKTVKQNLMLSFDSLVYDSKDEFLHELENLCQIFSLGEFMDEPVYKISGGTKQKVSIVRSILSHPDILLADEPTSNLDRESSHKLFEILSHLSVKRKMTVIWATHSREMVKSFNGKIMHLEKGRIIYSGKTCFI